jgi:hypothetical protein
MTSTLPRQYPGTIITERHDGPPTVPHSIMHLELLCKLAQPHATSLMRPSEQHWATQQGGLAPRLRSSESSSPLDTTTPKVRKGQHLGLGLTVLWTCHVHLWRDVWKILYRLSLARGNPLTPLCDAAHGPIRTGAQIAGWGPEDG